MKLAGERRNRGFTERLFVAARNPIFDPALLQAPPYPDAVDTQDRHAADHLISTASPSGRRYRLTAVAHPAAPQRPFPMKN